jgi:hypothetical protein
MCPIRTWATWSNSSTSFSRHQLAELVALGAHLAKVAIVVHWAAPRMEHGDTGSTGIKPCSVYVEIDKG